MTDPTVVSLCRQYLQTWNNAILPLLCDRLEELGRPDVGQLRDWFFINPVYRYHQTIPAILKQYNGGEP